MHLDAGQDVLPSKIGALCSILLFVVMIVYTGYKISILDGKKSIDIIQAVKENHFDDNHIFTSNQGLNIAIGIYSASDPRTHELLDQTYGRVRFNRVEVKTSEDG